jgi:endonuclease/exonuclease/phosphatase family metal-dependent hydrolase
MEILDSDECRSDGQIVCGDFNVTTESYAVAALLGAGFNYSHCGVPGISTGNSNGEAKLIDYLFFRGSLKSHAVAPPVIDGSTPLPSGEQPSDHLPLVARFNWL